MSGPAPRSQRAFFAQALAWVLAFACGLGIVATAVQRAAAQQLAAHAEQVALQHAQLIINLVPDLEPGFAGGRFSPAARAQLRRLHQGSDAFRFKLFDRDGRQLLASEDLASEDLAADDSAAPEPAPTLDEHRGNERVRAIVLGGLNHIELKRGQPPERPLYYSEAYVPVPHQGRTIGVVEVYVDQTAREGTIRQAQARVSVAVALVLLALGGAGAYAWWRWQRSQLDAQARVDYLAQHDVLSGTLNRASFADALKQALWRAQKGGARFAVLCVDLDHFKDINDSHGQAVGDDVLRQVGDRLRALVRQGDHVARLGSDEFAVLQGGVGTPEAVTRLAQRIVDSLGEPYDCGNQRLRAGASVGAAVFGDDATDLDELMHKADLALYRAKAQGRSCFSFYDAALDAQLQTRRELTQDLRQAIEDDALALHFQPLYEGRGRRLVGYEALARWNHPSRGAIPPSTFIPLAEETGLIDRLGRWVLQRACSEASRWPGELSVAVNLSPAQFRRDDPVQAVQQALQASGLPARRLELEITESLLMSNTDAVLATLHRLSGLGVRIAMDDFGTGYSSLAYLWRYPFDKLKIDRAFVQGLEHDPKVNLIVKSIIGLAHSMDIRVNAEGVETPGQLQWLQLHGCDELQGFLLGRPGPVPPLEALQAMQAPSEAEPAPGTALLSAPAL